MSEEGVTDDKCILHSDEDIDSFCKSFDEWQKLTIDLSMNNSDMATKIDHMTKQNTEAMTKLEETKTENKRLADSQAEVHKQLNHICDLEEEVRALKEMLNVKDEEIRKANKEMGAKEAKYESEKRSLLESHDLELSRVQQALKESHQEELRLLKDEIIQKDVKIEQLQNDMFQKEEETRREVMKISMEYESKITKLKQKITTATSKAQGSSNQDIFRMKLQNMKLEHEHAVRQLNQTIAELEGRLSNQNRMSASAAGASGARKRKF